MQWKTVDFIISFTVTFLPKKQVWIIFWRHCLIQLLLPHWCQFWSTTFPLVGNRLQQLLCTSLLISESDPICTAYRAAVLWLLRHILWVLNKQWLQLIKNNSGWLWKLKSPSSLPTGGLIKDKILGRQYFSSSFLGWMITMSFLIYLHRKKPDGPGFR